MKLDNLATVVLPPGCHLTPEPDRITLKTPVSTLLLAPHEQNPAALHALCAWRPTISVPFSHQNRLTSSAHPS